MIKELEKLAAFNNLLTSIGVYGKISDITKYEYESMIKERENCRSLDLHCPHCKADKTFIRENEGSISWLGDFETRTIGNIIHKCNNIGYLLYKCPTCNEKIFFVLLYTGGTVIKLAQYPSLYDVSRDELKQYKKNDLIDEESFNQVYKADICASSGYFVAAYTYMRRVYETLMASVFKQNESNMDITEEAFKKLGGHEKIQKIRPYLAIEEGIYGPLYSLLSGGVHTYTEEECSTNYAFLKMVLLDVLAEQKAKKEREAKRKEILKLHSAMRAEGK